MKAITALFLAILLPFAVLTTSGCTASADRRSTGQTVDDTAITARVNTALARDASLGQAMNVDVTTYRGVVQLSGFVNSRQAVQRAGEIANDIDGVRSVENNLQVTPQQQ